MTSKLYQNITRLLIQKKTITWYFGPQHIVNYNHFSYNNIYMIIIHIFIIILYINKHIIKSDVCFINMEYMDKNMDLWVQLVY